MTRGRHRRWRLLGVTLGILLVSAVGSGIASAADHPPLPTLTPEEQAALDAAPDTFGPDRDVHYTGVVEGTDIYVAVVDSTHGAVSIYLCDGEGVATWLTGLITDGAFEATSANGATATGTIADGVATGSATLADGTELTFSAPQAPLPAGLFVRQTLGEDDAILQVRTIVLPDGTARGSTKITDCSVYYDSWKTIYVNYTWARANGDEIGMTTTLAALKSVARQYDACKAAVTS